MVESADCTLREQLAALHTECWGWALACCKGQRFVAEEVLHMSYHKILDQRARFDGRSAFKTWLFAVIRFTAADYQRWSLRRWLRFRSMDEAADTPDPSADAGHEVAQNERCAEVRGALARLARRQSEVLHLVFYHDLSLDDAAAVMGISPGSARQHYERGKNNLRKQLNASHV